MNKKIISIVIPAYNEEKNVENIYYDIRKFCKNLENKYTLEIIFINDGSLDETWEKIKKISKKDKDVKGISFSRNFGHQNALQAGLKDSRGSAVITIDCDLQHPVELILDLVKNWEDGFKVVNTTRKSTQKESLIKRLTSNIFYRLINIFSETKIEPGSADFRLLDREVVNELNKLTEKDIFYRGLVNWVGFKRTQISYSAKVRLNGKSSYSFKKMLSLARVGITSFSMLPMKIIVFVGIILFLFGFLILSIMLYFRIFINPNLFSGSAILAAFIIFNNGLIIILIGIISIYQINMIKELKNRPNYIVEESVNIK